MELTHSQSQASTSATPTPKTPQRKNRDAGIAPALPERGAVVVCPHPRDSELTRRASLEANALHALGIPVQFYCTQRPEPLNSAILVHELGSLQDGSLVDQSRAFAERVARVQRKSGTWARHIVAIGSEWASAPALQRIRRKSRASTVLTLASLESQRSDMSSSLSRDIEQVERDGLGSADCVMVSNRDVAERAEALVPACAPKLRYAKQPFPTEPFEPKLDPGHVKARYRIGPLDPVVLFVGNMDWSHGPDILCKAMPALLRNHGHLRAVFVGDGDLLWPVRVQARYMLIEHAVRMLGHREGKELHELIAASDIIVVPSRERTEDWQIVAGWAACRPVVATHPVATALCEHENNAVLIYSNPGSCVWGIERVLYDGELRRDLGIRGRQTLDDRLGWKAVAQAFIEVLDEFADSRSASLTAGCTAAGSVEETLA